MRSADELPWRDFFRYPILGALLEVVMHSAALFVLGLTERPT